MSAKKQSAARAEYRKNKAAEHSRKDSANLRDIGPLPKVAKPARRKRAAKSLRAWALTYFPERFPLPFSRDHDRAIDTLERVVRRGGNFAFGMPRGSGKTTLCEVAVMFAACEAMRRFIALIGATGAAATEMLESITGELESNELLAADYPEVCYPIQCLEGISNRRTGQTIERKRTQIEMNKKRLVLPTVDGKPTSGIVIDARGLTGRIRGMKFKPPGQPPIRPDLAIIDDCQTDASAYSHAQCQKREATIKGSILGLGGPGNKIPAVLPCTVIRRGDVADRLLDRGISPEWNGFVTRLVDAMPPSMELWERYNEQRVASLREYGDIRLGTDFYRKNRKKMDAGVELAWPERFDAAAGEISAVQHAMNLRYEDLHAFQCEYQNEPPDENEADDFLDARGLRSRINGLPRAVVPVNAEYLTAFVDIQGQLLYWAVMAVTPQFGGFVVDYGSWPDQPVRYFSLATATRTLSQRYPRMKLDARIMAALAELVDGIVPGQPPVKYQAFALQNGKGLMQREYARDDGTLMRIGRLLIDANWGDSTSTVYAFARQSLHSASIHPAHGRYIGPTGAPIGAWQRKPGERIGDHWLIRRGKNRQVRHVIFDSNWWKTQLQTALAVPVGDAGSISLYAGSDAEHRMVIDHLVSEKSEIVRRDGDRSMTLWKLPPNKPDNHLLDCLSGCMVAASIEGAAFPAGATSTKARGVSTKLKRPRIRIRT